MATTLIAAMIAVLLAMPTTTGAASEQAGGTLIDGSGNAIGTVQLAQTASGVAIAVSVTSASTLKPGDHGIHFHSVGRCDGPDFASAGPHFNPTNKQHGLQNPSGPHAGDLPNFTVGPSTVSGSGYAFAATSSMISLSPGPTSIFDADGTALVIHVNADDERTDPSGNSGGRVACAVLIPGESVAATSGAARIHSFLRRLGDL